MCATTAVEHLSTPMTESMGGGRTLQKTSISDRKIDDRAPNTTQHVYNIEGNETFQLLRETRNNKKLTEHMEQFKRVVISRCWSQETAELPLLLASAEAAAEDAAEAYRSSRYGNTCHVK